MRPLGHSPSSTEGSEPRFWLLDSLIDAPSSFAASLIFIRRVWGEPARSLSVDDQIDVVKAAASDGLIELRVQDEAGGLSALSDVQWRLAADEYRRWLSNLAEITQDDVAYDPVGLWLAITEVGREYWSRVSQADAGAPRWTADYDAATGRIVARAESIELARRAAVALARNLGLEIEMSSESVSSERADGVEVRYAAALLADT